MNALAQVFMQLRLMNFKRHIQ